MRKLLVALLLISVCCAGTASAATLANLRGDFQLAVTSETSADLGIVDTAGDGVWNYYASSEADMDSPTADSALLISGNAGGNSIATYTGGGSWFNLPAMGAAATGFFDADPAPDSDEINAHPKQGSIDPHDRDMIVMRWTAGAGSDGIITISGSFRNPIAGQSSQLLVLVNGIILKDMNASTADISNRADFSFDASIAPGGTVDFVVTNWGGDFGSDESYVSGLIETSANPIAINDQPDSQSIFADDTAIFELAAAGVGLSYQWYQDPNGLPLVTLVDGGDISGATSNILSVANADGDDEADYYCIITDAASNTLQSDDAGLIVKRMTYSWDFDGDAVEVGGSGFDGVVSGGAVVGTTNGINGGAVEFDGVDGKMTMGNVPLTSNFAPTGFTVSYWVNPSAENGSWKTHVGKGEAGGNYCLYVGSDAAELDYHSNVWMNGDWGQHQAIHATWDYPTAQGIYAVGEWTHVVLTYDNAVMRAYADGLEVASLGTGYAYVDFDVPFELAINPFDNFFFKGMIDEVKLFNYAISKEHVADIYIAVNGGNLCIYPPALDTDGNCKVDLVELSVFASSWLECGLYPTCN